jgi:hypothetical protein
VTVRLIIWGLAAAILMGAIWWIYEAGRSSVLTEQAVAAADAERKRVKNDATLRDLPDYDLCLRSLRLSGLRDFTPCDELRGLARE